jgi:hypothetical protein
VCGKRAEGRGQRVKATDVRCLSSEFLVEVESFFSRVKEYGTAEAKAKATDVRCPSSEFLIEVESFSLKGRVSWMWW